MNFKLTIALLFVISLILGVLYLVLYAFVDCETVNTGIWEDINSYKNSFCESIRLSGKIILGGLVCGALLNVFNYFILGDKKDNY